MKPPSEWSLRLRIFLFFALIAAGGLAATVGITALAARAYAPEAFANLLMAGIGGGLGLTLLCAWVWLLFDENVARPILKLSGELRLRATAEAGTGRELESAAPYLGALAPSVASVAEALSSVRDETGEAVDSAVEDMRIEKTRLEAVLRDLREGLMICNTRHEVLLYNREAQRLLGDGGEIGLGRPLAGLLTADPIRHALERLRVRLESGAYRTHPDHLSLPVICACVASRALLQGRVALIVDDGADSVVQGFALTVRDATRSIADQAARDAIIRTMIEELKRPAAGISAATEILSGDADIPDATHARFSGILEEETRRLSRQLERLNDTFNEIRIGGWTMNDVSTVGLAACLRDRLSGLAGLETVGTGEQIWLHCDSFSIVELLAALSTRLVEEDSVRRIALSGRRVGQHVNLDLDWEGAPVPEGRLGSWLGAPLTDAIPGLSGRDVLLHHRTNIWSETGGDGSARLRLPLQPPVEDHVGLPAEALPPRPEFYDFGLLDRELPDRTSETPLSQLSCVVFDTETTGLYPSAGDEIVQVAGVRVVNGRVLSGETFDHLVNPGRHIPAASTKIHGITDEMVAEAGAALAVLPAFHDFVGTDTLIAHNAPFDMKFLHLKEGAVGRRFDMPVLDTVLLAAHLFGQEADLSLDALANRFDVRFPENKRHTALADAVVTADVFCRLLPALSDAGVHTLGDALDASEQAVAIRKKQAAY